MKHHQGCSLLKWNLSAFVQAMQGRYLPLAVVYHKDYESAKRAFLLHHQLYLARGIVYLILMLLPFFEVGAHATYI
jgi:two pore calcium channel protein